MGSRGPTGPQGERGLPGPRGRTGLDGEDGSPGTPGVSLWTVEGSSLEKVLIPPKISGGLYDDERAIIVKEGDHLKLSCVAYSDPKPVVSWNRVDGNAIPSGSWRGKSSTVVSTRTFLYSFSSVTNEMGSILNITQINRQHMGSYVCEANNGIPPSATKIFKVQVHCEYSITDSYSCVNILDLVSV